MEYQGGPRSREENCPKNAVDRSLFPAEHPKGDRDTSCVLLVEEQSGLLRSTGRTGQKPVIALTAFTPQIPVPGVSRKFPRMVPGTRPAAGFQPGTRVFAGNCGQAVIASTVFARRAQYRAVRED